MNQQPMLPLSALPDVVRRSIRGVLTDIDETLSTKGKITAQAYSAMERLRAGGRLVVPVTGRPAGWCDHIARMWPVDAVVGENGALYMIHDDRLHTLEVCHAVSATERRKNRRRLSAIASRILREVPGCAIASDQPYRESDLAIDYCEDVTPISAQSVERIVALMAAEGMTAKVSTIHVNGWFGNHNKLSMSRKLFADVFGIDLGAERERFVFVGDSPNDSPMFDFFPYSVGVANVRRFAETLETPPKYVTKCEAGAGFAELADFLLGV
ncbi:MAG TPA: HAD-IIB family hydrolase [Casimicrobiaceae bacterium]|nr:HAD-IIB family hydrolase [Casimicrobiaceae bacterium]